MLHKSRQLSWHVQKFVVILGWIWMRVKIKLQIIKIKKNHKWNLHSMHFVTSWEWRLDKTKTTHLTSRAWHNHIYLLAWITCRALRIHKCYLPDQQAVFDISIFALLDNFDNLVYFKTNYIVYQRKFFKYPLAQPSVLLALGHRAMGYAKPWTRTQKCTGIAQEFLPLKVTKGQPHKLTKIQSHQ